MALEGIGNFLKLVLKNGGASFALTLILAFLFREYFDINPATTVIIIELMLWLALYQAVYTMIRGEVFTTLQKWRDYRNGKSTITEMDGKSLSEVGKDVGLNTLSGLVEKGLDLKVKISETKSEKKKNKLQIELDQIELELEKAENRE